MCQVVGIGNLESLYKVSVDLLVIHINTLHVNLRCSDKRGYVKNKKRGTSGSSFTSKVLGYVVELIMCSTSLTKYPP